MDTFEIDVQFYPQIEKFMEQLHSGTEREENIFLFGTRCYFQNEQFYNCLVSLTKTYGTPPFKGLFLK